MRKDAKECPRCKKVLLAEDTFCEHCMLDILPDLEVEMHVGVM